MPAVALSVKQPWAELILQARKTIEVRTWTTAYRGPFVLHTGKQPDLLALDLYPDVDGSTVGAFIGIADLIDIEPFTHSSWSRLRPAHLVPGGMPEVAFAWHVASPRRLVPPVPGPGRLGLFPTPTWLSKI